MSKPLEPISSQFAWLSLIAGAVWGALSWTNLDGRGINLERFSSLPGPYGLSTFLFSVILGAGMGRILIPLGYRVWPLLIAGIVWAAALRYILFPTPNLTVAHLALMTVPVIGVGLIGWLFWSGRIWGVISNVCGTCGGSGRLAENDQCHTCLGTGVVQHSGVGFFVLIVIGCGIVSYISWSALRAKAPVPQSVHAAVESLTFC